MLVIVGSRRNHHIFFFLSSPTFSFVCMCAFACLQFRYYRGIDHPSMSDSKVFLNFTTKDTKVDKSLLHDSNAIVDCTL